MNKNIELIKNSTNNNSLGGQTKVNKNEVTQDITTNDAATILNLPLITVINENTNARIFGANIRMTTIV